MVMKVTVYIDVLICVNLIINYFILSLSFKYVKCATTKLALLRGAMVGAVLSLVILLPELPAVLAVPLKFAVGAVVVFSASLRRPPKVFVRLCGVFLLITFAMCGVVYFLCSTIFSQILYINNGVVYFDISPFVLIALTTVCYIFIYIVEKISQKRLPESFYCKVGFEIYGKNFELFGKLDSGNTLKEPFSQKPVIIIAKNAIDASIIENAEKSKVRMIPFKTLSGAGMLQGVRIENLTLDGRPVPIEVYIAISTNDISPSGADALISCELAEYLNG